MGTNADPRTWNMFRRREERDIWCAVPADTAVPRFLFSGDWKFSGQQPDRPALPGFQRTVARQAVRMNGFYLFQVLRAAA